MFLYYLIAWRYLGRQLRETVTENISSSPNNLSAAALRFVRAMECDSKTLATALIALAESGRIAIADANDLFTLERLHPATRTRDASKEEAVVLNALFRRQPICIVSRDNYASFKSASAAMRETLGRDFEGKAFVTNLIWFRVGLVILALTAIAASLTTLSPGKSLLHFGAVGIFTSGAVLGFREIFRNRSHSRQAWGRWTRRELLLVIFCIGMDLFVIYNASKSPGLAPGLLVITVAVLAAVPFRWLLKKRTQAGVFLAAQIEGFRSYLEDTLRGPGQSGESEASIPFVIALDTEPAWQRRSAPKWLKSTPAQLFELDDFSARLTLALDEALISPTDSD